MNPCCITRCAGSWKLIKQGPHLYDRNRMGWLSDLRAPLRPCFLNLLMKIRMIGIYLPLLMMASRSSVHESTGFSPKKMVGHQVLLSLELVIGQAKPTGNSKTEYIDRVSEQMEWIHQFACQHLKLSSNRQRRNYDHRPVNQH